MTLNPDTRPSVQTSKESFFAFAQGELERLAPGWMLMKSPGHHVQKILAGRTHEAVHVIPIVPHPWSPAPEKASLNNQSDWAQKQFDRWRVQLGDVKAFRVMVVYPGTVKIHVGMVTEKYLRMAPDDLRREINTLRKSAGDARVEEHTRNAHMEKVAAAETALLIKTGTPYARA